MHSYNSPQGGDNLEKSNRRLLPVIDIRMADIEDLSSIVSVADSFFSYGGFDAAEYDRDIFTHTAEFTIMDRISSRVFIAEHDNKVVGYYALSWSALYSKRPTMYETHFAVLPEYRASHAARLLTKRAIALGEEINAIAFYAGATSGINSFDNSILNMYAKCGMKHCGAMMRYKYG
jgi:GNAT superfamily N-acetyltransferase